MTRINDISTNSIKGDIINNSIKETFKNTNTYNTLLSSSNPKIATLVKNIEKDMENLDNSLIKFDSFLNNYLDDYKSIESHLAGESGMNINSSLAGSALYAIEPLNNIKLNNFNVPSPKLILDYEASFENEDDKENRNNQPNNPNNVKNDDIVLKSIEKNFENNKNMTSLPNQELYKRKKEEK